MSWMPATASVASNSRQASSSSFSLNGSPTCTAGRSSRRFLGQFARGKRRAGQSVAARLRADVKNRIADAAGRAARDLLVPQHAEAKDIHQRVALEAFVEINLAADRRDADAIAVVRDAGDHAGEEPAIGFRHSVESPVIGPKRSELSKNSGRAPIVKMSRMIPPTPVAAPWNGSIALG